MCCGSKRRAWLNTSTPRRAPSTAPRVSPSASNGAHVPAVLGQNPTGTNPSLSEVRTSFPPTAPPFEAATKRVRGPVTGRWYEFSGAQPPQVMDPRDGSALLRSGLFGRA